VRNPCFFCRKIVRLRGGMISLAKKQGFRTHAPLLRRFTLLDPRMYDAALTSSRGRGPMTRALFLGAIMLMASVATLESIRVLCGAKGYRG